MISESVIKYIIGKADRENINKVTLLFIKNLLSRYREEEVNHILDMITGKYKSIIGKEDVDEKYIKDNLSNYIHNYDKLDIINFKVVTVDNIDCQIMCSYSFKEKINLDRDDINYSDSYVYISFISNEKVLKKS